MPPCQCRDACLCAIQGAGCIQVTGQGTASDPYVVDLPLVDVNSPLSCGPQGLEVDISVAAGTCTTMTGNGSAIFPLTVDVVVDPDPTNALSCGPDGLYVSPGVVPNPLFTAAGDAGMPQPIAAGDTLTFDGLGAIATTAVATDTVQIGLNLRSSHPGYGAGCNGLFQDATGLSAPPDVPAPLQAIVFAVPWPNGVGIAAPSVVRVQTVLTNTSTCRTMYAQVDTSFACEVSFTELGETRFQISDTITIGNPAPALPAPSFGSLESVANSRNAASVEGMRTWLVGTQGIQVVPPGFQIRAACDVRFHSAENLFNSVIFTANAAAVYVRGWYA